MWREQENNTRTHSDSAVQKFNDFDYIIRVLLRSGRKWQRRDTNPNVPKIQGGLKVLWRFYHFFPLGLCFFLLPSFHILFFNLYNLCRGMKDYEGYQGKNATFYKSIIRIDGSFGFCLHILDNPWCSESSRLLFFFLSSSFFIFCLSFQWNQS